MNCNGCTDCCKAIHVNKRSIRRAMGASNLSGDRKFIFENWKPISARRAKKRNPHVFDTKFHRKERVQKVKRDMQFFKCCNLTATGCAAYESRPEVCRGYPWYGREPRPAVDYSADCVYNLELE